MKFPNAVPIPDPVLAIVQRLEGAGFETWCVGGTIRDFLLGVPAPDAVFDIATAAPPKDVRRLFRRTVPVGIEHGTVAVLDEEGRPHEVTTFRRDVKTDGRHAVVEFGVSLDDDLARRDFTINAIAYQPLRREWRDPLDGAADLEAGLIRAVGDPATRFREDYLRILRAVRFATRFGFAIEEATWAAAQAEARGLAGLSAERVRDEWFKSLRGARRGSDVVRLWDELGALALWLPSANAERAERTDELNRLAGVDAVLLTAWLSDDPGAALRKLRCSNAEIEGAEHLAAHRGRWPVAADPTAVRRWLADVGTAADDLVAVAEVEGTAAGLRDAVKRARESGDALALADLAVNGRDLIEAGVPEGPAVGRVLRGLLDIVLERPERNTRGELLEAAERLFRKSDGKGSR